MPIGRIRSVVQHELRDLFRLIGGAFQVDDRPGKTDHQTQVPRDRAMGGENTHPHLLALQIHFVDPFFAVHDLTRKTHVVAGDRVRRLVEQGMDRLTHAQDQCPQSAQFIVEARQDVVALTVGLHPLPTRSTETTGDIVFRQFVTWIGEHPGGFANLDQIPQVEIGGAL